MPRCNENNNKKNSLPNRIEIETDSEKLKKEEEEKKKKFNYHLHIIESEIVFFF